LARMVERISNKVPASRRMEPPAELVGPTLEKMRYLDEGGPLWTIHVHPQDAVGVQKIGEVSRNHRMANAVCLKRPSNSATKAATSVLLIGRANR